MVRTDPGGRNRRPARKPGHGGRLGAPGALPRPRGIRAAARPLGHRAARVPGLGGPGLRVGDHGHRHGGGQRPRPRRLRGAGRRAPRAVGGCGRPAAGGQRPAGEPVAGRAARPSHAGAAHPQAAGRVQGAGDHRRGLRAPSARRGVHGDQDRQADRQWHRGRHRPVRGALLRPRRVPGAVAAALQAGDGRRRAGAGVRDRPCLPGGEARHPPPPERVRVARRGDGLHRQRARPDGPGAAYPQDHLRSDRRAQRS